MKIELPDDTPAIALMKFAASLNMEIRHRMPNEGGPEVRMVKRGNVRTFPNPKLRSVGNSDDNGPEAA